MVQLASTRDAGQLGIVFGNGLLRRILPEELGVGHGGGVELGGVLDGSVEHLAVGHVSVFVVLRLFYFKIGDPAQLTEDVSFLHQSGVVGHPRSLHFVLFVRV